MLSKLKERKIAVLNEIKRICETANARDNSVLTAAEHEQISTLRTEQKEIDATMKVYEEVAAASKPAGAGATATDPNQRAVSTDDVQKRTTEGGSKTEAPQLFKSFGEQLRAVYLLTTNKGTQDQREQYRSAFSSLDNWEREERAAAGMAEYIDSSGGYLVQPQFAQTLLQRAFSESNLAGRCTKIPLQSNRIKIPGLVDDNMTNGNRWGGIQAYWGNEADSVGAARPTFRYIDLSLEKLMAFCYATDELLEDAPAMGGIIQTLFGQEFSYVLDNTILYGDGNGKPLGLMNSPSLITVTPNQASAQLGPEFPDVTNMRARLFAPLRKNAAWFIQQDVEPSLIQMAFVPGASSPVPVWMPGGNIAGDPFDRLFNIPIIPIDQAQTVGTPGDILLAALSEYLLIDKNGMQADSSMHVQFLTAQMCFRFQYRVNGQPTWDKVRTPQNGSNTTSPFVALGTRT